jgi:hypothetical protein
MRNFWVASLWLLLCSGWCLAQGPADGSSPEKNRSSHDLMARSEMQAPRSIPITRRLRFEEIPVEVPSQNALQDDRPCVVLQPAESAVQTVEKAPAAVTGTPIIPTPITAQSSVEVNGSSGNSPQR